jgi:uncharacterized protein YndB with AHSA1/START domain
MDHGSDVEHGTYVEHDGRPAVRFVRSYPHPVERVWAALTDPEELGHWFPSSVRMEQRAGGRVTFDGDPHAAPTTGTVLVFDPPRRLAYTWGGDELHFTLEAPGTDRCTLTMVNVLDERDAAARNAAGWQVCLAELDKHVAGVVTAGPHSDTAQAWQPLYDAYVAEGMPAGAPIPAGS